jgi:hypothetical protein
MNNPLEVKENDEHSLDFALHLPHLSQSRWIGTFLLGGLLFCLRVITVNAALITSDNLGQGGCIVRGDLTKLLADGDMLLLLFSCQNPGGKFGSDMMHVQFSSHNLLSKALNCSTSILMNELLTSGYSVRCCGADGPTCIGHPQWISDWP